MKQLYLRSLIASLAILVSICANAYDACIDGIYYNFYGGNEAHVTYRFYNNSINSSAYSGDVVIPEAVWYDGRLYNVTDIGEYAFNNCSLSSISIPTSVTDIEQYAFENCSLWSIRIPNSVTRIGSHAFSGCYLGEVEIPNSVTSIGYYAFSGCSGLTSVKIPTSVTSIDNGAFNGCSQLKNIYISNLESWIKMEKGYDWIDHSYSLYLNDKECTSIDIPSSITSIGDYAFKGCNSIKRINISDLEAWVKMKKGSFWANDNYSLYLNDKECTSITIPSSITNIGDYAFAGCSSLTNVKIPSSVKSIGEHAFSGCI